jgi:hypothetical protein
MVAAIRRRRADHEELRGEEYPAEPAARSPSGVK